MPLPRNLRDEIFRPAAIAPLLRHFVAVSLGPSSITIEG
jgi:hypothetical protein